MGRAHGLSPNLFGVRLKLYGLGQQPSQRELRVEESNLQEKSCARSIKGEELPFASLGVIKKKDGTDGTYRVAHDATHGVGVKKQPAV